MNCPECKGNVDVIKQRLFKYEGVRVEDIYLLNVEVKVCSDCETQSPILRNVIKLHDAIGRAIVMQPGRLSGDEMRYLRRSSGSKVQDWVARLGVTEYTYSRWENSHQAVGEQSDRLGRLLYLHDILVSSSIKAPAQIAKHVMELKLTKGRDYVIAVDMENLDADAVYISLDSPLLMKAEYFVIEAHPAFPDIFADVFVVDGGTQPETVPPPSFDPAARPKNCYASVELALAA